MSRGMRTGFWMGRTSLDFDYVSYDDLSTGNDLDVTISDDMGCGRGERTERVHRLCGSILPVIHSRQSCHLVQIHDAYSLYESNSDVDDDDCRNDSRLDPGLDARRDGKGEDQNERHGVEDLGSEDGRPRDTSSTLEGVGPIAELEGCDGGRLVSMVEVGEELGRELGD
jgi:hypothetical protein